MKNQKNQLILDHLRESRTPITAQDLARLFDASLGHTRSVLVWAMNHLDSVRRAENVSPYEYYWAA